MARDSAEVWAKRVERWRDSGLTAAQYSSEVGVNPRTLVYWSWRLRQQSKGQVAQAGKAKVVRPTFVEFRNEPPAAVHADAFELVLPGGVVVRVPPSFDAGALRRLLDTVHS